MFDNYLFPPVFGLQPRLETWSKFQILITAAVVSGPAFLSSLDRQEQSCGAGNSMENELRRCLKSNWGHERFRPYQLEVLLYMPGLSYILRSCLHVDFISQIICT